MPLRKKSLVILSTVIAFLFFAHLSRAQNPAPGVHAADDGLALTPPMGWYPWNEFGQEPQNEKLIKEIVDALVSSGLKEAGYEYVGPDEGICFYRDAGGKLTSNLERYPSGLRGLGDYIHKRGLKYALYTDAGTRTCSKAMPGTKDHEFEDMLAFAEWRADYLKIDWCNTQRSGRRRVLHEASGCVACRRAAHRLQPVLVGCRGALEVGRHGRESLADDRRHLLAGEGRLGQRDEGRRRQRKTVRGGRPRPLE